MAYRPLWKIREEIKNLRFELEMLKKDPSASREEIEEAEDRLTSLRTEYKERVAELEGKSVPF